MHPENLRGVPVDDELRLRGHFDESRRSCESAGQRHLTDVVPRWLNVWTTIAPSPDSRPHLASGRWVKGRARDDEQFRSAFLELYLDESLIRAGYVVTIHPSVNGTTTHPDFLVERAG